MKCRILYDAFNFVCIDFIYDIDMALVSNPHNNSILLTFATTDVKVIVFYEILV